jgi:hypothetical protein
VVQKVSVLLRTKFNVIIVNKENQYVGTKMMGDEKNSSTWK